MKSFFLLFMILGALITSTVLGQTKKTNLAKQKKDTALSAVAPKEEPVGKSSYDKFYERLGISYFGVFTSPTLEDWNSANAAISPEYGDTGKKCRKNCDTYAMNLWNQVNFSYNFGAKMKFNIIPRFTIMLDNSRDMDKSVGEDRATINLEDALVGFSGVVYSSSDKKFNWWMRPALRLPTSRFSRNYNNGDFGTITYQPEWNNTFTYDFNKELQIGITHIDRVWVFEDRFNNSRHRMLNIPYLTYALDDLSKFQIYYEHFWENNKNFDSINKKNPVYKDVWQNLMVGVSRDITPKLNVMPFLSAYVNDVPFSTRSMWIGAWIGYTIK